MVLATYFAPCRSRCLARDDRRGDAGDFSRAGDCRMVVSFVGPADDCFWCSLTNGQYDSGTTFGTGLGVHVTHSDTQAWGRR